MICDWWRDCLCRFRLNWQGSKIGRFWPKFLGNSPWFWAWPILASPCKTLETLWNAYKTVLKWFVTACATVCVDLGWIGKGRKLADFDQKALDIAHDFEHGRFWQVLEIGPQSLKRLQNRSKTIGDWFLDCLCRFRVNSQGSKIGRFWAKGLGYSPWFWTWSILASPEKCSKLSETPPKPF